MFQKIIPRLLWIGLLLEIIILVLAWLESRGTSPLFFQAAARLSGRISLLFFAMVFVQATKFPDFDRSNPAYTTKYRMYRDFAIVHSIHWCLLATAVYLTGFELVPFRVAGGALAYVLVLGMPVLLRYNWLTNNRLNQVQGFYLFWVWLIFLLTYVARLKGQSPINTGSPASWWPLAIFTAGLMLWRILLQFARR